MPDQPDQQNQASTGVAEAMRLVVAGDPVDQADAADALAVALCHAHSLAPAGLPDEAPAGPRRPRSWRQVKPEMFATRRPS